MPLFPERRFRSLQEEKLSNSGVIYSYIIYPNSYMIINYELIQKNQTGCVYQELQILIRVCSIQLDAITQRIIIVIIINIPPNSMQTQSDLYFQSQEQITPIIDYIPLPENTVLPASSKKWRIKEHLDESQEKAQTIPPSSQSMQPLSSIRIQSKIERLNTDSVANDYDKKTTSIMQGRSANTIPSNEVSISVIRDNLRSYMTSRKERQENQNSQSDRISQYRGYSTERQRWRGKSRSRDDEKSMYIMNERSKLLRNIDRSLESQRLASETQRYSINICKKQRTKLLTEILSKLQNSNKSRKNVQLVKSNCKDNSINCDYGNLQEPQEKSIFAKKVKKWVQTKNALKNAAFESTQKSLANSKGAVVSEWKFGNPQSTFQSPRLIHHPDISISSPIISANFNTASVPNRRQNDQIFTFNNLQALPFQTHNKNVSISVSDSSSKEYIGINAQIDPPVGQCVLCKVIGKRCSFH